MKDRTKPLLDEVGGAPKIAVVGTPNAGKSTLVNRLSGTRTTVVHETPGVTRDRKVVLAEWVGRQFALVDTGGYDLGDTSDLAHAIRAQIRSALAEAVAVLMVVDAQAGPLPDDYEIAQAVRRTHLPVILAANKIDDPRQADLAAQFTPEGAAVSPRLRRPGDLSAYPLRRFLGDLFQVLSKEIGDRGLH